MEPLAILLLLLVLAFIVLFVTRPFFKRQRARATESSHEYSSLLAERERLLTAIQELDFDQALGKIPAEDYPAQRSALLQKGVEVLRQLDVLTPIATNPAGGKELPSDTLTKSGTLLTNDDLEDLLAKRRSARKEKTAGFCPKCGKPVLQSDVFCPACGNTLSNVKTQ